MKTEILEILQMQNEGKLTREQAAELLAALADQAREKAGAADPGGTGPDQENTHAAPAAGAPGPRTATCNEAGNATGSNSWTSGSRRNATSGTASATIHEWVDAAIGMGTTVGRAASVWGGQLAGMVHRDDGANSISLSKVDPPAGAAFSFRNNVINMSKVSGLELNNAEFTSNSLNASRLTQLALTAARFSQCNINGSSLHQLTIDGPAQAPAAPASAPGATEPPAAGIRACTFSASKFHRVRLSGGSIMDTCVIQAAAIKDAALLEHALLKDSRISDTALAGLKIERATCRTVNFERVASNALHLRDITLDRVTFSSSRLIESAIAGGAWTNVKIRRDSAIPGNALIATGQPSLVQESFFDNCTLTDCDFAGCTFRRTTLRNLTLTGITVRNIDFTGLTLDTQDAFRKAAGL